MDESVSVVEYAKKVMEFFVHESCGKCTPCRVGAVRALELLERFSRGGAKEGDVGRLDTMMSQIMGLSACGLGQAAGVAVRSAIKYRPAEFEEKIARA